MTITETPERWVILKLPDCYKVFGTWVGGYLGSDNWKLNSGIERVEKDNDFYYFIGFSGSCYKCNKRAYGIAGAYGRLVLSNFLAQEGVELMEDVDDWASMKFCIQ